MFVSRGNALNIYVFFSLLPHSHIMFVTSHEHKILMDPRTWAFNKTQSDYKVSFLPTYLQGKWGVDSPTWPCFLSKPELASKIQRAMVF